MVAFAYVFGLFEALCKQRAGGMSGPLTGRRGDSLAGVAAAPMADIGFEIGCGILVADCLFDIRNDMQRVIHQGIPEQELDAMMRELSFNAGNKSVKDMTDAELEALANGQ